MLGWQEVHRKQEDLVGSLIWRLHRAILEPRHGWHGNGPAKTSPAGPWNDRDGAAPRRRAEGGCFAPALGRRNKGAGLNQAPCLAVADRSVQAHPDGARRWMREAATAKIPRGSAGGRRGSNGIRGLFSPQNANEDRTGPSIRSALRNMQIMQFRRKDPPLKSLEKGIEFPRSGGISLPNPKQLRQWSQNLHGFRVTVTFMNPFPDEGGTEKRKRTYSQSLPLRSGRPVPAGAVSERSMKTRSSK